jgi:monothiol glutaredoxin
MYMQLDGELKQRIEGLIGSDRVVLFMKGTRHFPQCGFSATVTQILNKIVPQYATVNVLADPGIRDGIKAYSEWPTIPQLYVDGKFVGGCDIVREMFQAGELHTLLGASQPPPEPAAEAASAPKVTVSAAAKRAIEQAKGDEQGILRLEVTADFEHALSIDQPEDDDFRVDAGDIVVLVDRDSAARANGVRIDFEAGPNGDGGFRVDNPNEPAKVRQLSPAALKSMLDAGEKFELFDVRTPEERAQASIAGARARLLDDDAVRHIEALDKDTPLVFHCHHGGRSQAAAERFVRSGFKRVYNLAGGIDAWSTSVDPSVPRY